MRMLLPFLLCTGIAAAADPAPAYIGAEACGKCHRAEFDLQSKSAHAHTLAPSAAGQPGDWAFGAGGQAITFVAREDREHYRELGRTWYRELNGYSITPGHKNFDGVSFRLFDSDARILRCFACHSTGPITLAGDDRVVPHELGVRCEMCHGPGSLHAQDPAGRHPRNPGRLGAAAMNTFCASCHRFKLETGEELTDLRDPRNSRSEPLRLAAGACFQKSAGRLTCLTCHSPHAPLEQAAAAYDRTCSRCHASPKHSGTIAAASCSGCHMPPIRTGNLVFVNHRIAIYRPQDPVVPR
jgi:hypothetical protein